MGTDRDWEKWGMDDPYFGVISLDEYRNRNLSEPGRAAFFRSGEEHVETLLDTIRTHFQPEFSTMSSSSDPMTTSASSPAKTIWFIPTSYSHTLRRAADMRFSMPWRSA